MTKTILLGMTAEELLEKLLEATPQESMEFKALIESMDNGEEIKEAISTAAITKAKKELFNMVKEIEEEQEAADAEGQMFLGALKCLAEGMGSLLEDLEEDEEEEEIDLASILRAQMNKPKQSLTDQLKAQLEPKKSLKDILVEQMSTKKTLVDTLKEQIEEKTKPTTVSKEDILNELIESILETELNDEQMVISNESSSYQFVLGLMFSYACMQNDVCYELEETDVEFILTSVAQRLISNGRKVEILIEDGEVFTVIK